jgi:hypothetical protein
MVLVRASVVIQVVVVAGVICRIAAVIVAASGVGSRCGW